VSNTNVMPKYWMELDEGSMPRAITALAEELDLEASAESTAHYLVMIVYTNLDAAYQRKRAADGLPVTQIAPLLQHMAAPDPNDVYEEHPE